MSRLSSILSFICCILYYNADVLFHKTSAHTLGYQIHTIHWFSETNIMKAQYGKLNMINTSFIVAPVKKLSYNDVLPPSNRAIHSECNIENVSPDTVIHDNCFNDYDPRSLCNIDSDINYHKASNTFNSTPYYDDQTFRDKNGNNIKLSMFHLNIRSIPDQFTELTTLLSKLDTDLKIIAISETWIKPHHIGYNIPNYYLEQNLRLKKIGGGVALYLHNVLHYRLRNDLKIGNDSDSINSVYIEIDKSTAGRKHNIIVGIVYRPPWVDLSYFNELLNNVLDLLHGNHYVSLQGDFNVDLSHAVGTNLPIEEFKNSFLTHHLYPLINKPTHHVKSSNTIIDNIFCNVPNAIDTCISINITKFSNIL